MAVTDTSTLFTTPLIINGKEHRPSKAFDVIAPATGKIVHKCASAGVDDAAQAVDAAAEAFTSWRKTTPLQRRDIFLKAADVMRNRRAELQQYMADETGGTEGWCNHNINAAINFILDIAGRIATLQGTVPTTADPNVSALILQEPYGVVLAIAPW
jgi:acyl-CoA reductase-like NAD-dependent aldehyde dehydrogenase